MRLAYIGVLLLAVLAVGVGCTRNRPSEKPPIHPNPNMDIQPRYNPQAESEFFADGKTMRTPPAGTVARGQLRNDIGYYTGLTESGDTVRTNPREVDMQLLKRGQERYDIYCSPCHARTGDGQGIMVQRGYIPPPSFHMERLRAAHDGHIFWVISNGIRNMPSYRSQVPVDDRWAIVAYVRALQRAQNATLEDIPTEKRESVLQ